MNYSDKLKYIHKYLTNELSSLEKEDFGQWLEESNENRLLYEQLNGIWINANYITNEQFDYKNAFNRHKSKLHATEESPKKEAKILTPIFIRSIASILIVIIMSVIVFQWIGSNQTFKTYDDNISVTLDDGTKVWLDKKSELEIISLSDNNRLVTLVGKAFFDVANLDNNPFRIETRNANIKVVGTKLLVDTRNEVVNVKTGKVEVSNANNTVILTQNQSVSFKREILSEVQDIPFNNDMLWFNDELKFNNATFDKVISDISKEYKLFIELPSNNNWSDCLFTSGSLKGNTFDQILIILEVTFELEYIKNGETSYKFTKVNCK